MSSRYSFQLSSEDRRRDLPRKIIVGRRHPETTDHVLLKLLGYLLFYRERLQVEARMDEDVIPFDPDLVELDYQLRPALWIECGECTVTKLNRLAVKVPEAELWILRRSEEEAEELLRLMARHELRRRRYRVLAFETEMFDELTHTLAARNEVYWVAGGFDPPGMQFDFNGLWFDVGFRVWTF